jgi:predicted HicB family RNase H-like nuclease
VLKCLVIEESLDFFLPQALKEAIGAECRGYGADMRYSECDGMLVWHVAGIRAIVGFHGESVPEVRRAFEEAVDFYLETETEPEKPFSGRIVLQVTPETHAELFRKAQAAGAGDLDAWLAQELIPGCGQNDRNLVFYRGAHCVGASGADRTPDAEGANLFVFPGPQALRAK